MVDLDKGNDVVLITGVTGFIAVEIAGHLIDNGWKNIRGTCRSVSRASQKGGACEHILNLAKQKGTILELVEADLLNTASIEKAVSDQFVAENNKMLFVSHILHVASPYVNYPKTCDEIFKPAIEGTLTVLRAAKKASSTNGSTSTGARQVVKQVVITGSIFGLDAGWTHSIASKKKLLVVDDACEKNSYNYGNCNAIPINEDFWGIECADDKCPLNEAYGQSKLKAEKAAWAWAAAEKAPFHLSTVLPGAVLGRPKYCGADYFSYQESYGLVVNWLAKERAKRNGVETVGVPHRCQGVIDVADVVLCHVNCLGNPKAFEKRIIAVVSCPWYRDICDWVQEMWLEKHGYITDGRRAEGVEKLPALSSPPFLQSLRYWAGAKLMGNAAATEQWRRWSLGMKIDASASRTVVFGGKEADSDMITAYTDWKTAFRNAFEYLDEHYGGNFDLAK